MGEEGGKLIGESDGGRGGDLFGPVFRTGNAVKKLIRCHLNR